MKKKKRKAHSELNQRLTVGYAWYCDGGLCNICGYNDLPGGSGRSLKYFHLQNKMQPVLKIFSLAIDIFTLILSLSSTVRLVYL